MPDISTADTFTKSTAGFEFLDKCENDRMLIFTEGSGGSSIGTSTTIQFKNDVGRWVTIANGSVTEIPQDKYCYVDSELRIVTVGSPDFNVTMVERKR